MVLNEIFPGSPLAAVLLTVALLNSYRL